MKMNKTNRPNNPSETEPPALTIQIIISNGIADQDSKLDLECEQTTSDVANLWLVKLPRLASTNALTRPIGPNEWELRLQAVHETLPLKVLRYSPDSVAAWVDGVSDEENYSPTEVLIFAVNGSFTTSISAL